MSDNTDMSAAIEAAKAAFTLASREGYSDEIVFRADEYSDVHASVQAALLAKVAMGSKYQLLALEAEYGIRGSHLAAGATIENVGGAIAVVVSVKSEFEISASTQINVIGNLYREVINLADVTDAFVPLVIFIIETRIIR